jgi:uncharacterized protein YukE
MTDAFDPPKGDPGALSAAAGRLSTVTTDLNTQLRSTKSAVAAAVSDWRGPRTDDFRHAGAGLQMQLAGAITAVGNVSTALSAYAKALTEARAEIAEYKRQYDQVQSSASAQAKKSDPASASTDMIWQHAAMRQGQLVQLALGVKSDLSQQAAKAAAAIDAETGVALPNGGSLSPGEIRRRVTSSLGVAGLQKAIANGTASSGQAWTALAAAKNAVPAKDVNDDGSINWSEAAADVNDKYLGPPITAAALGTTPSAGWAFYRLVNATRAAGSYLGGADASYAATASELARLFQAGAIDSGDVAVANYVTKSVLALGYIAGPGKDLSAAQSVAGAGGIPDTGAVGVAGKFLAGLGLVSDAITIWNPGVENKTEGNVLRVTAGLNAAGTATVLGGEGMAAAAAGVLGVDAAVGWVPVAGQVVVIGTGLVLAGDYVYHHWDQISHGVSTAYHATTHALGSAAHAVGHVFSSIF